MKSRTKFTMLSLSLALVLLLGNVSVAHASGPKAPNGGWFSYTYSYGGISSNFKYNYLSQADAKALVAKWEKSKNINDTLNWMIAVLGINMAGNITGGSAMFDEIMQDIKKNNYRAYIINFSGGGRSGSSVNYWKQYPYMLSGPAGSTNHKWKVY